MKFDRIKHLRLEHGINRETLAKKIGVSLSALATYERGEREPGAALIVALADYFNVTSDYILGLSDTPKVAETWPLAVPVPAVQSIADIKASVEEMISSAVLNPYGLQTLDAYATIISLLSSIDTFAENQLVGLQMAYPDFKQFGAETEMVFDEKPLLLALADGSEEASKFAKRLTATIARISDRTVEVSDIIRDILSISVFDSIKGQSLEKQPKFAEQMRRIKQSLGVARQASEGTDIMLGGGDDGNSPEAGE